MGGACYVTVGPSRRNHGYQNNMNVIPVVQTHHYGHHHGHHQVGHNHHAVGHINFGNFGGGGGGGCGAVNSGGGGGGGCGAVNSGGGGGGCGSAGGGGGGGCGSAWIDIAQCNFRLIEMSS